MKFAGLLGTVIRVWMMQSCVEDCTSLAYHYDTQLTVLLLQNLYQKHINFKMVIIIIIIDV